MKASKRRQSRRLRLPAFVTVSAVVAYLWVGPVLEHRRMVHALERPEPSVDAMRTLCRTDAGVRAIHEIEREAKLSTQLELSKIADEAGCLFAMRPEHLARHALHLKGEDMAVGQIVGHGKAAIDPAIEALEFGAPIARRRAALALVALFPEMSNNQKYRARRRLDGATSKEAQQLRDALGGSAPKTVVDPPPKAPTDDFKLGGSGLRLTLEAQEETEVPSLRLRDPVLHLAPGDRPQQGVLFRKGAGP